TKFRISGMRLIDLSPAASSATGVNTLNNVYPSQQAQLYPPRSAVQTADTPMMTRFDDLNDIWVSVNSPQEMPAVIEQITAVLRERHRLRDDRPDDFKFRDLA